MIRHLFRKHQMEGYGAFWICKLCGVLQYKNSYDFKGTNATYAVLKELQPNKLQEELKKEG